MIEAAPKKVQDRYFEAERDPTTGAHRFKLRKDCIRTGDTVMRKRYLDQIVGANTGGPDGRFAREPNHTPSDYAQFMSLILSMLQYDPARRIRASEALKHPFVTMTYRQPTPASAPVSSPATTSTAGTTAPKPATSVGSPSVPAAPPAKALPSPSEVAPAVKAPAQTAR